MSNFMKKNFYKEYQKKQKLASNYEETDKISGSCARQKIFFPGWRSREP